MIDFENTLFHEILHRYVADWFATTPDRTTALMGKYKTEPSTVLNHLHLYGIERVVYRKLEREKDLEVSIQAEQMGWNNGVVLKRAREITPGKVRRVQGSLMKLVLLLPECYFGNLPGSLSGSSATRHSKTRKRAVRYA